jgi:prepilin-type N-terminal cleavage/methylation domain-containing protein
MATPSNRPPHINPAMRVVMRLPATDATKDPWTGAPITSGRNFADESAIDENVALAPPEGKSPAELYGELEGKRLADEIAQREAELAAVVPPKPQFTLTELLVVTTIAGVGLGGARVLPAGAFACLVGTMAVGALWLSGYWQIRSRWAQVAVWSLVGMYVIAAIVAIVRS